MNKERIYLQAELAELRCVCKDAQLFCVSLLLTKDTRNLSQGSLELLEKLTDSLLLLYGRDLDGEEVQN